MALQCHNLAVNTRSLTIMMKAIGKLTITLKVTPENYEGDLDFLRKAHHALLEVCGVKIYSEELILYL